jgi:hypothetical protein
MEVMTMELKDWLVIGATVLGPILAVQAQKIVELLRERRTRKLWVFQTLMATRAARLSAEHVQALNMINLAFYGQRFFGINRRSKGEQSVLDAWKEYHDHLNDRHDEKTFEIWFVKGNELFVNILFSMATELGFSFDRVELNKGAYSPIAHGELEREQSELRKKAIQVLSGETPLSMNVESLPADPQALQNQLELQKQLLAALNDQASLSVVVKNGA